MPIAPSNGINSNIIDATQPARTQNDIAADTDSRSSASPSTLSLAAALSSAVTLISTCPEEAVPSLTSLQERTACADIWSIDDEIDDVQTSCLPLLAVDYHLAQATLALGTKSSADRHQRVIRSTELFHAFLRTLERLRINGRVGDGAEGKDVMDAEMQAEYYRVLDEEHDQEQELGLSGNQRNGSSSGRTWSGARMALSAGAARDAKIARYRKKKIVEEELERLDALAQRRQRLGVDPDETMEGMDGEGLLRTTSIARLRQFAMDAIDEIRQGRIEMEMLQMAVEMERRREEMDRHRGSSGGDGSSGSVGTVFGVGEDAARPKNKSIQATRITKDSSTGQLQFKRDEIRSHVFKPGWNQPTMTLRELGDIERAQAVERSRRQKDAERRSKEAPRRYEQLEKDGLEDVADLVDASAEVDRKWDDFKDENPRGSGNKMADRGDRNF